MLLYRELDGLQTDEQLAAYRTRLVDRFGPVPHVGEELMQVVPLRRYGKALGCEKIVLKQDRMTMFFVQNPNSPFYQSEAFDRIPLQTFELRLKEIGGAVETVRDFALQPVSNFRRDFSGELVYTAKFTLENLPARAAFSAQYVFECMELTVNGKTLPRVFVPPYAQDITEALREGENELAVRVVSTALRDAKLKQLDIDNFDEIMDKVRRIFREVFDDDTLEVNDSTNSSDIEDWDSLEHITLVVAMENEFGLKFDLKEVNKLANVGEMVDLIASKL